MEFRHLRYFLALADELHYGRAAQRLSISQPPLSVAIQQLEASVGARLFDRDSKGVRLTPAGAAFRGSAQALIDRAEDACALARDVQAGEVGRLRVGFVGSTLFNGLSNEAWFLDNPPRHPPAADVLQIARLSGGRDGRIAGAGGSGRHRRPCCRLCAPLSKPDRQRRSTYAGKRRAGTKIS